MRGVLVTGTDTGVGKSILAAAICAALAARGERVAALKPVVTGLDEPPGDRAPDHELLAAAASAGQSPEQVASYRFGPAVSPHLAAEMAGVEIDPERLLAAARALASDADALVVEGVGGLLVPLTASYSLRDLAVALGLPVVVAARPGLGTINHTLLAVEAARASGLDVRGVAMTPWPAAPTAIERSNLATVAGLAGIEVTAFPFVTPGSLLPAEARLPLDAWVTP